MSKPPSITKQILRHIPVVISFAVTLSITITWIYFENKYDEKYEDEECAVYSIFFGSIFVTKFLVIFQVCFLRSILQKLFTQLKETEIAIKQKYEMNFNEFFKHFIRKTSFVFGIWLISFSVCAIFERDTDQLMDDLYILSMKFSTSITVCHTLFYVELLRCVYDFYSNYVDHNNRSSAFINNELLFLKTIHYQLFEISITFISYFGWIILSIFLQQFVDIIYHTHLIFLSMMKETFEAMSKYVLFL